MNFLLTNQLAVKSFIILIPSKLSLITLFILPKAVWLYAALILRCFAIYDIIAPEIGIRNIVYKVSSTDMVLKIKNRPNNRAGSLNNTLMELITEFSICWISLVSLETTPPFFLFVKKFILNANILLNNSFLMLVTIFTLILAIIIADYFC